jgi:ABC-type Fe3+/spermidine/putrescine transport system ATPase subunit
MASRPASRAAQTSADLRLVDMTRRYGAVTAVDRVHLDVAPGEFLTLLGPSGCGKTTLLKCIAGFVAPSAGEIVLRGEVINDVLPHLRNIGIVFQHYALFPHMTVAQNIAFGLAMRKRPRAEIARRVDEMLRLVKLPRFGERYPHQLSGGQQQRVALARVLAVEPVLLLLDEPFGALDKKLRVQMQIEVEQLITPLGVTTIFVTHDQEDAIRMSDRVAVMNAGRIVQCDAPGVIYDRPHDVFVADFIGTSNLLDATIRGTQANRVRFEVAGVSFEVSVEPGAPTTGDAAVMMVRPENLALSDTPPPAEPCWAGVVSFALHAGPVMEYEVVVGESARLRVSRPRMQAEGGKVWSPGDRVAVTVVDPSAVRVLARPADHAPGSPSPH